MIFYSTGMVSEAQKEAIRKEARGILDGFAKALNKMPDARNHERRAHAGRVEGMGKGCDEDFRRRVFANAPKKNDDCIIAEKGAWI